jgi:hypothetical protein
MRVRSSDTKPIAINEVIWPYASNASYYVYLYFYKGVVNDGSYNSTWVTGMNTSTNKVYNACAVNRRNGDFYVSLAYGSSANFYILRYSYAKALLKQSAYDSSSTYVHSVYNGLMEVDAGGGIWFYSKNSAATLGLRLSHYDANLTSIYYYTSF